MKEVDERFMEEGGGIGTGGYEMLRAGMTIIFLIINCISLKHFFIVLSVVFLLSSQ